MRITIGMRLAVGFGLMIALVAVVATAVFVKVRDVNVIQQRVVELRMPTAVTGSQLRNGINHSLAALRGYMILGTDKWTQERALAWESIDENIAKMQEFSQGWTVAENISRLEEFTVVMAEFKTAQEQIEAIANSPAEQPAMVILFDDAAPRGSAMMTAITAMIDEEKELEATPERKALLATMADSRGSLASGLASIRAYLLSGNIEFANQYRSKWEINTARLETLVQNASLLSPTQAEAFAAYSEARVEFAPLPEQMFTIRGSADWNIANKLLGSEAAPRAGRALTILSEMIENQEALLAADAKALATGSDFLVRVVLISSFLACLIGCVIAVLLTRMIIKPIKSLNEMVKDVATGDGDLTKRLSLSRSDEIGVLGKWFDTFLDNLHGIISDVAGVTQEVAGAATEIAASSEELSAGMMQQQEQTSQVAAAMEEMSYSVTEVAKKAGEAAEMSGKAGTQASQGGEVVEQTIEGMNSINDEVNQSAAAVGELGKRGEQIGEVISVINDIAEQTNLLALNAAIEAARAGEHGRGFAVVADEVRKLAERTTKATEEVAESINAIQQETTCAVERMEQGKAKVTDGVTLAGNAGDALREIVSGSGQVAQMIQSIAAGAEQQSAASTEVSRSIESINAISNESAEGVRQAAEAATQLSTKAEQLQALVNRFKI